MTACESEDDMNTTVKLYVVRHGETYLNRYHKLQSIVIRQLLDRYSNRPEHQGEVKNASVSVIEFIGDQANVLTFNNMSGSIE